MDRPIDIRVSISRQRLLGDADATVDTSASWRAYCDTLAASVLASVHDAGYPDVVLYVSEMPGMQHEQLAAIRVDGATEQDRAVLCGLVDEAVEWVTAYGDWVKPPRMG
jgi:hypothetical protein